MNRDVAQACRLQAALREIFARHSGEAAVDDVHCHEKLRLVGEYAAELLSHKEHAKLPRNAVS